MVSGLWKSRKIRVTSADTSSDISSVNASVIVKVANCLPFDAKMLGFGVDRL